MAWEIRTNTDGTKVSFPTDDIRDHVLDGPCPCMPRTLDGMTVHHSYAGGEVGCTVLLVLHSLLHLLRNNKVGLTRSHKRIVQHVFDQVNLHWPDADLPSGMPKADLD